MERTAAGEDGRAGTGKVHIAYSTSVPLLVVRSHARSSGWVQFMERRWMSAITCELVLCVHRC